MSTILIGFAILVLGAVLIIPTKTERHYILRGKSVTLKGIVELICPDGVIIWEGQDEIQVAYDHDPSAIEGNLKLLAEAEVPASVFNETSILVKCPVIYGEGN